MAQIPSKNCAFCNKSASLYCYECQQCLCPICQKNIHDVVAVCRDHKVGDIHKAGNRIYKPVPTCDVHNKEFLYYCSKCDCLTCKECITSSHNGHITKEIKNIADIRRKDVDLIINTLKTKVKEIKETLKIIDKHSLQIQSDCDSYISNVEKTYKEIQQIIDRYKLINTTTATDFQEIEEQDLKGKRVFYQRLDNEYSDRLLKFENLLQESHDSTFFMEWKCLKTELQIMTVESEQQVSGPRRIDRFNQDTFIRAFIEDFDNQFQMGIQSMQLEFLVLEEKLKKEEDSLKKLNNEKQLAIDHYTQQVQRRDSEIQSFKSELAKKEDSLQTLVKQRNEERTLKDDERKDKDEALTRLRVKELAFTKLTKEFSELKADVERKKRKEDDDVSESITVFPGGKPLESSSVEMPEKTAETCVQLTEAGMVRKARAILYEYLHFYNMKEALICVEELNCPSLSHVFVSECINQVLQRSLVARRHTGLLLHDLVKKSIITDKQYVQGLNSVLVYTEDMTIFIPKLYQYFGELIGLMVQDGSVPLSFLKESCQPLMESGQAGNLVAKILHDVSDREDNEKVRYLWRKSGLEWSDFVPEDQITQFLKEKQLEYTIREDITTTTPTVRMTLEKIKDNLHDLLEDNPARNEEIFDWIEADLDDFTTKDKKFIRALMTAVCSSAILISGHGHKPYIDATRITARRVILQKYLDHQVEFELQALYALQALVHKLEHPQGFIRTLFDSLYDEDIISEDAFNQWEASTDPVEQEGKGVAMKDVAQFFKWLREADDEVDSLE